MKNQINKYFETDRSYRSGVTLVIRFSPKLGLKKQLNVHPESDYLKGCIFEELRELADLKISELNAILSRPVKIQAPAMARVQLTDEVDQTPIAPDDEYASRFPATASSIQEDDDLSVPPDQVPAPKGKKVVPPVKKQGRKK